MLQKLNQNSGWLIIIYRVPSTPSTSRVTIWKRVKLLGAFLLQQSVYILPSIPTTKEAISALKEQIQHLGGECKILEITSLGEQQESEVIAGFNKNREEEYIEVVKACKELSQEIDEESKTEDFHFADLEENEKHLQRVRELLDSVIKRDYFEAEIRAKAFKLFNECEEKFAAFSHEVYAREGIVTDDKKPPVYLDFGTEFRQNKALLRGELVTKLQEMVNDLNQDSLVIGTKKVGPLSEQMVLEWDYRENKGENIIEIKISWSNLTSIDKEHFQVTPVLTKKNKQKK
jgi:hypothetical protein